MLHLNAVDAVVLSLYFVFVLGIGFLLRRRMKSADDFLLSERNAPLWITSVAFISANLGAQELIGMVASSAKYGIMTAHFYWIGAIPAMLFLGVFMMPFYYGSKARSVPEYLALRYDEKTRAFNAVTFCIMTLFSSGVSLYALAILFENILNWDFNLSIFVSAGIVLAYTFLGGLTSVIYNEVLQFCLIVLGIFPVVYAGLHATGGFGAMQAKLPEAMMHLWSYTGSASQNPMGVNALGMIFGLGVFLSFGYWCTDYLVIQRAMAARDLEAAELTPVVGSFPKLLLPIITITPGLIAVALMKTGGSFQLPVKPDGAVNYDLALPMMLAHFYPHGLFGVGLTALLASFMSGMAGNVTAFNSVLTYDIYESYIRKGAPDSHYLAVGKWSTVLGILFSIGTAYVAKSFNNIMDLLQMVFGFVNAPLFAVFLLGMFTKRATGRGSFLGLLTGTSMAALTLALTTAEGKGGWIANVHEFPSAMAQSFGVAIVSWSSCFLATLLFSLTQKPRPVAQLEGLVYGLTKKARLKAVWYKDPRVLAVISALVTLLLNFYFW